MTNDTYNVLNTLAGSGADSALANHILSITGAPKMDIRTMDNTDGVLVSLAEGIQGWTLTPTAVASFRYSFEITQYDKTSKTFIKELCSYTSLASGDTATTIGNAFRAQIAAKKNIHVTASGSTTLIVKGQTGYPMISVKITSANWGASDPVATQVAVTVASYTAATPTVLTSTAHGLLDGQVVVLASSDNTHLQAGTYRVCGVTANTFKLTSTDGITQLGGSSTATVTATVVAQHSRGQYTDLVLAGVSGANSSDAYSTVQLGYNAKTGGDGENLGSQHNMHTVYVKDTDVLAANYIALAAQITANLKVLATAAADPEGLALV